MAKFVQLTPDEGTARVFVNLDQVRAISPRGPFTLILFSDTHIISVKEPPGKILGDIAASSGGATKD